jgi:predicted AAA+ superfamily ATPase
MYIRKLEKTIRDNLFKEKIIVLYGPRQVGKTTLVKKIYDEFSGEKLFLQCDIPSQAFLVSKPEPQELKKYFGNAKLVILDEAQVIENIGLVLKTFFDTYRDVQIIATGSSSFDLANKIREPLTGRAVELMMYPLSVEEIIETKNRAYYISSQNTYFKYGLYPGSLDRGSTETIQSLGTLENNTFYKDIFTLDNVRKPKVLHDLLKYLALNIGSVVTSNNLANEIKTTSKTIERYIDILEKMFVIKKLYGYSNNKISEIKKGYKIYFIDMGIRNSIINNFNDISLRNDGGGIFENFFVVERLKKVEYSNLFAKSYFWQGERGLEVDYIEELNGESVAFECKIKERKSKGVVAFKKAYPSAAVHVVTLDNYLDFII